MSQRDVSGSETTSWSETVSSSCSPGIGGDRVGFDRSRAEVGPCSFRTGSTKAKDGLNPTTGPTEDTDTRPPFSWGRVPILIGMTVRSAPERWVRSAQGDESPAAGAGAILSTDSIHSTPTIVASFEGGARSGSARRRRLGWGPLGAGASFGSAGARMGSPSKVPPRTEPCGHPAESPRPWLRSAPAPRLGPVVPGMGPPAKMPAKPGLRRIPAESLRPWLRSAPAAERTAGVQSSGRLHGRSTRDVKEPEWT